jgi:hypothetical protein
MAGFVLSGKDRENAYHWKAHGYYSSALLLILRMYDRSTTYPFCKYTTARARDSPRKVEIKDLAKITEEMELMMTANVNKKRLQVCV